MEIQLWVSIAIRSDKPTNPSNLTNLTNRLPMRFDDFDDFDGFDDFDEFFTLTDRMAFLSDTKWQFVSVTSATSKTRI